jgi:putative membrane protein (TIGR04086 family)
MAPFDAPEEDIPVDPAEPEATGITRLVVLRGAATGLIFAMPAALLNVVLANQTPKPRAGINLSSLVVFFGFGLAGWMAGREAPRQAAKHGALAALAAFVSVELIVVLGRPDRSAGATAFVAVFTGLLAACIGTIGGSFGSRKRKGGQP